MIQPRKESKSKMAQAKKQYKVTMEGINIAQNLLSDTKDGGGK